MKHHPEITDDMISIFTSILTGGETNRGLAVKLILKLDPVSRRDLRAVCQTLDQLVEDVWVNDLREKRIDRRERAKFARLDREIELTFGPKRKG
jgi:hypothetical protein